MNARMLTSTFVAPVFFFLSLILFLLTGIFLVAAAASSSGFIILSGLLFILGYNAFRFGILIKG
jgi:hypothetical protein